MRAPSSTSAASPSSVIRLPRRKPGSRAGARAPAATRPGCRRASRRARSAARSAFLTAVARRAPRAPAGYAPTVGAPGDLGHRQRHHLAEVLQRRGAAAGDGARDDRVKLGVVELGRKVAGISSASRASPSARSGRPPSRNARSASVRRLRSRRSTAISSPEPLLRAFCSSERTIRSVPTRSLLARLHRRGQLALDGVDDAHPLKRIRAHRPLRRASRSSRLHGAGASLEQPVTGGQGPSQLIALVGE